MPALTAEEALRRAHIAAASSVANLERVSPALTVALRDRCLHQLKAVLKMQKGFVITYVATGHGAGDASIANLFSPGDKVLVPQSGYFDEN